MGFYKSLMRPILFRGDAERMHNASIALGRALGHVRPVTAALHAIYDIHDARLETDVCGIHFQNPIGLAAGYDKSGDAITFLESLGFSHIEIGSVSADISHGNPKPRLFRLPQDQAIVVHYGLQNDGSQAIAERLAKTRRTRPLGINIVKTNRGIDAPPDSDDDILDDYARSVQTLKNSGDYLTLNLSCPNTEMGRDFFAEKDRVIQFLQILSDIAIPCPVFLKVSPLGGTERIDMLLEAADGFNFISGFVFNLAPGKSVPLTTPSDRLETMPGAVAGKPVETMMNTCIRELYQRMDKTRYRIIGIGGVFSAQDAYTKIQLGASLVQLLTGMVYEGPGIVKKTNLGLCQLLDRDGFKSISEAVGTAETG